MDETNSDSGRTSRITQIGKRKSCSAETIAANEERGSQSEDNIYTNVWSILNHKIEKIPCQQVPSVKFIFIGP
ncbi:hypothetical protein DUI87_10985 [Hirundo rustica rustica]|uniref:Uncharacterized protein n=1 Tax=Hirundo rustica rustica TaxID=333673 RepID=A0A3M0L2C7_HIRRU|nr:hypothetical protein DUI87_10985 [Hirundo rustica rustica]